MSDTSERASPPVLPRLVVSGPSDGDLKAPQPTSRSRPTLAPRPRSKTESSALAATGRRQPSADWIDVDDASRRRKKTSTKRTASRSGASSSARKRSRSGTESEVASTRYSPQLSRISESGESRSNSRPSTSGSSQSRKQREKDSPRKARRQDESSIIYRRPVKHRVGGVSRKTEAGFKLNPSMLSVLSTLTGTSDRSSSSSTTITQHSYDQRCETGSKNKVHADPRGTDSEGYIRSHSAAAPNVFDFMETASVDDGHDGRSIYSSSSTSSHYAHSDAGSSELPDTPSSHSTIPSPSSTRNSSLNGSVAELRRKYDSQCASTTGSSVSARRDSQSSENAARPHKQLTRVGSVPEEDDEDHDDQQTYARSTGNVSSSDERRKTSLQSPRPVRPIQRPEERLRYQEEAMRHHLAQSQHGPQHLVDPAYGQHRSHSASSHGSSASAQAYAQHMAVQHYQYPSPPVPMAYPSPNPPPAYSMPPQAMSGHAVQPPAPDPPDLTQRTIAGYEQLALQLSDAGSEVKPLYRKFEYLNHRILLHMQDELCEMEDQLRCIDEAIAQMSPPLPDGARGPASRRGDAFNGTEMHHHRTALLGRIFLKTEQYSKAMASFAAMTKDTAPAEPEQVADYQEWLKKNNSPIHEVETRFLQADGDLIRPERRRAPVATEPLPSQTGRQVALTCLPFALMLPLLLFSVLPTLAARLVVTALIAVGAVMVGATIPRVRDLLEASEWAVCGGVYVLLMTAIAGCIPVHAT